MKPIYIQLQDHQYPCTSISHVRPIARALLENDQGLFAFNHIVKLDKFGQRDYPETPGGGLEPQETLEQAVIREIEEEVGVTSTIITKIGVIEDTYNLILRKNISHYFYCRVTGIGQLKHTDQEKTLIQGLHWLTLDQAYAWYKRLPDHGIAQLIKQRELPILTWLITYKNHVK
jgi:8-oxo-dGTP pyrophosphatase MutT (NUDIX family)